MASALSPFATASPDAVVAPSNSSIHNNPFVPQPADSPPVAPRDPAAATSIEVRRAASSGAAAPAKRRDRHGAELAAFQRDRFPNSSRDTRYPDFLEKLLDEFVEAQLVVGRGADVQFTKDSLQNARAKLSVATGTKGWRIWLKEPLFNRFRDLKQSSSPADTTHSEFVELLLDLHDLVEIHEWDKVRHMLTDVSRDSSEHSGMANLPVVPTMASMMPMPHRRHQSMSGIVPRYDTLSTQQSHQQVGLRPFYVASNGLGSVPMPDKEVNVNLTQPPPSMESNWVDFGSLVGSPNLAELSSHHRNAGVPPEFATNFAGLSSTSADSVVKRSHTSPGNARTRGLSRSASQVPGDMLNRTKSLTNANKKTRDGASSAPIPAQRRPSLRSVSGSSLREDGILPPAFYGHRRTGSSLSTTSIRSNSSASGIFYPLDSPVMRPLNELPHQPQWVADSELMMQGLEGINTLNLDDAVAYMEHQHRQQQQQQQPLNLQSSNLEVHQSQAVPTFLATPPMQTLPLIVDYQANPLAASPFPQQFTATGPDSGMFPHSAMGAAGSSSIMRAPGDHQYTTLGAAMGPVPAAGSAIMTDSLNMTSSASATGTPGSHDGMDLEPTPSMESMYEDLRTTLSSGEAAAHFSKQRPPPPQNLQEQQRQIAQHRLQQHEDAVSRQQQQIQQHHQRQAFERHQQQAMTRQQIADQVQMQFQVQMQHQQQQLQQQNHHQQQLQQQNREQQLANGQFIEQARADAVDMTVSNMDAMLPPPIFAQSLNLPPHQAPPRSSSAVNGVLQGAFTPILIAEPLTPIDSTAPMFGSPMADVNPPPPSNVVARPPPVAPAADSPQQHRPQQLPAQHSSTWRFRSGTGSSSSSAVSPLPPPISTSGLPAGSNSSPASAGAASPNGRSKRISKILNRLSFVKGGSNSSANNAPLASPPLTTGAVAPAGP
ncbi:hypothetical protein HDU87_006888 [Geranomyces variabilis]|uniref:Uncharacterized protein n=1 Tax=Geranomyces variabilis TaxID=109894 RepID=A0AAD5TES8_9FUNG|nr:hypothetical protein HDU87_006888 [Geranomyces variabilis]